MRVEWAALGSTPGKIDGVRAHRAFESTHEIS